eukprot:CAMPEP_0197435822 /NCGR_PEP_ID=MMETSP1175-20131217/3329_1 /TAXON_ID=1003142 /ORGANISM="Triceratium dubium, Strain CCMP147" /LENGTH=288 /DNA_ID=CAMNT_0042964941 /DNA_START=120 /DNA_END=986 /DNA_ORIENTATION=+
MATTPSLRLPLLHKDDSTVPIMACNLESRLLALRHRVETGQHKHALPTEQRKRQICTSVPSVFDVTTSPTFKTPLPSTNNSTTLVTPPTPGKRKRQTTGHNDMPSFLPAGIRSRVNPPAATATATTQPSTVAAKSPSSKKRIRIAPRYESSWLASLSLPFAPSVTGGSESSCSGSEVKQDQPTPMERGFQENPRLIETLKSAARVMEEPGRSAGSEENATAAGHGSCIAQASGVPGGLRSMGHRLFEPQSLPFPPLLAIPVTPGLKTNNSKVPIGHAVEARRESAKSA